MIKSIGDKARRFGYEIAVGVSRLRVSNLACSPNRWFFTVESDVVAIAADAPLIAPSTPANAVMDSRPSH